MLQRAIGLRMASGPSRGAHFGFRFSPAGASMNCVLLSSTSRGFFWPTFAAQSVWKKRAVTSHWRVNSSGSWRIRSFQGQSTRRQLGSGTGTNIVEATRMIQYECTSLPVALPLSPLAQPEATSCNSYCQRKSRCGSCERSYTLQRFNADRPCRHRHMERHADRRGLA
jgi:hypothetical protein